MYFKPTTLTGTRALMKLLSVINLLILLYPCVSHECQAKYGNDTPKHNALERQQRIRFMNETKEPKRLSRLHQLTTEKIHKRRLGMIRPINVYSSKIMNLSDDLGYHNLREWVNDIINIEKQSLNAASISLKENERKIAKLKRVRRENRNRTKQSLQCEVASLSCRNCCGNLNNCPHKTRFCRCDPQCTFYNDCCVDFKTFCGKTQAHKTLFEVDPQRLSCIKPNMAIESGMGIWTVSKCPDTEVFDDIIRNCETADETGPTTLIQKFIPVVVAENNLIFRNEFCAKCNGFEKFEYFAFEIGCDVIPPSTITLFEELLEFVQKYCETNKKSVLWDINHQSVRKCNQYFRHLCPTMKELDEKCNSKSYYSSIQECASSRRWCDLNISKWDDLAYQKCTSSLGLEAPHGPLDSHPRHAPFTVALHLSTSSVKVKKCRYGLFYDPYLQICRSGVSISSPLKENIDKFEVVVWLDIREISLKVEPTLNETIFLLARLFNFNRSQVSALRHIPMDEIPARTHIVHFKLQLTSEQTLRLGKANNDSLSPPRNTVKTDSTNLLPLHRLLFFTGKFNITFSTEMTVTVFKTSSRQLACIKKRTYLLGNYASIENGKYYYINSTGKRFIKSQVFFEKNKSISVCELVVFSTCVGQRINLTLDEYVKFENLSIFYNRTKTIYDFGEYDIEDGHVFMCISKVPTLLHRVSSDSEIIKTYLTLIGFILSLICLFLVIQTYLIFPELRNLPGKNILSLSSSLFLAQLVWLIPDESYPSSFCLVIAVTKHYLFLVSFVAMATIAWDTHSTFARKEFRPSTENANKKFCIYSVIVWGLPAMFVILSATADQKHIYAVYVNELWCWFDNEEAQKYLFVLPVGLLLLFNAVFFVLIVFRIKHVRSTTRFIRSNDHRKRMFWIYVKISTLMGFCWLFGFIDIVVKNSLFSYLFVIFASLQGVCIALAFVVKKSVWEKYKKLLDRKHSKKHHSDYQSVLKKGLSKSRETRV